MSSEDIRTIIEAIDVTRYDMVLIAGGEPSLNPPLIRVAIGACREVGIRSCLVSAPVWARTPATARRFLNKIPDPAMLILSYDNYHLEFLDFQAYRNACTEAQNRGLPVCFQIAYGSYPELVALVESLSPIKDKITNVSSMRTVAIGNASHPGNVDADRIRVEAVEDLEEIPRECILGNTFVDENFVLHGCCWASSQDASPFSRAAERFSLKRVFDELEEDPIFRAVRRKGFLDSLSARGKQALVQQVHGRSFVTECDICTAAMKPEASSVWRECQ